MHYTCPSQKTGTNTFDISRISIFPANRMGKSIPSCNSCSSVGSLQACWTALSSTLWAHSSFSTRQNNSHSVELYRDSSSLHRDSIPNAPIDVRQSRKNVRYKPVDYARPYPFKIFTHFLKLWGHAHHLQRLAGCSFGLPSYYSRLANFSPFRT